MTVSHSLLSVESIRLKLSGATSRITPCDNVITQSRKLTHVKVALILLSLRAFWLGDSRSFYRSLAAMLSLAAAAEEGGLTWCGRLAESLSKAALSSEWKSIFSSSAIFRNLPSPRATLHRKEWSLLLGEKTEMYLFEAAFFSKCPGFW